LTELLSFYPNFVIIIIIINVIINSYILIHFIWFFKCSHGILLDFCLLSMSTQLNTKKLQHFVNHQFRCLVH